MHCKYFFIILGLSFLGPLSSCKKSAVTLSPDALVSSTSITTTTAPPSKITQVTAVSIPSKLSLYDTIPNSIDAPNNEYVTYSSDTLTNYFNISHPQLVAYVPKVKAASGTSVIICPGGAYLFESFSLEGVQVAQQFAANGITAFVLKYRIPNDGTMLNKDIGPLQDAQRAIQLIRQNAKGWGLNPDKIGIVGFSAGGHLAASASTHFKNAYIPNPAGTSLKPDFQCLVYPLISMTDSLTHSLSRSQLLGSNPSAAMIRYFSNELQVTADTPPAFIVQCKDDPLVPYRNSVYYDNALKANHQQEQLYLYDTGGHGFGLTNPASPVRWFDIMMAWLKNQGMVSN